MDRRLCLLLALLCAGCAIDVPAPKPNPPEPPAPVAIGTITTVQGAVGDAIRKTYLETADMQDAGKLTTPEAMIADESARFDRNFDEAVQALANREELETGGKDKQGRSLWTPRKSAEYRRKVAGEP